MIETSTNEDPVIAGTLAECIDACFDCVQACTDCADACLGEGYIQALGRCIRLDLDCADVCVATVRILSRQLALESQMARVALEACIEAVRLCGEECEKHAGYHEHCRVCAESCRRCERSCEEVLSAIKD